MKRCCLLACEEVEKKNSPWKFVFIRFLRVVMQEYEKTIADMIGNWKHLCVTQTMITTKWFPYCKSFISFALSDIELFSHKNVDQQLLNYTPVTCKSPCSQKYLCSVIKGPGFSSFPIIYFKLIYKCFQNVATKKETLKSFTNHGECNPVLD